LSIHEGRALITTTPYDLSWLKQLFWDPWEAAKRNHPLIDIIRFDSTENPAFPKREFERARESMPAWRFDLFYRAIFSRPAGLIYGSFDETRHKIPRRHPARVAAVPGPRLRRRQHRGRLLRPGARCLPQADGRLFAYREYRAGERSAAEHCYHLMSRARGFPRHNDKKG
jgi:hypothetical protein